MRLFVGLDIDDNIRERLERFVEQVRPLAPDARWAKLPSLHVTLKFIGEKPAEAAEKIRSILRGVSSRSFEIALRGHGFFPNAHAARVFWVGIAAGLELPNLARTIDVALAELGIAREEHEFSPHVTLARGGTSAKPHREKGDRRNAQFRELMEKLEALPIPEFGTMTVREFFLYESQLGPGGSRYTKLESFPLRQATAQSSAIA